MKNFKDRIIWAAISFGVLASSCATHAAPAQPAGTAANRLIVKFKDTVTGASASRFAVANMGLSPSANTLLSGLHGRALKGLPRIGAHVIETADDPARTLDELYRSGQIEYAEPDYRVHASAAIPNDAFFAEQWGLHNNGQSGGLPDADIDAPEAWASGTNADGVVIGVIDSGVDYKHPDLTKNMWRNPGETVGNGIDDDGNGWVDDVYGVDTASNDADPFDDYLHGTHVSGILGATGNNGLGVAGVAWNTRIMALKFMDASGDGFYSDAIEAIEYALNLKDKYGFTLILNASWGGHGFSQAMRDTIAAARAAGVPVIAAAGNDGANADQAPIYPASYDLDNILSVGASTAMDQQASFSNFSCAGVDLFAPGEGIYSTFPGGEFGYDSGTSMAAPMVSGVFGLAWSRHPSASWQQVKSAVLNGVDQPDGLAGLSVTQGRVNLAGALRNESFEQPAIWSVKPAVTTPGREIVLTGLNFGIDAGEVRFRDQSLSVLSWSPHEIKAKLPGKIPFGPGRITVVRGNDSMLGETGACLRIAYQPELIGQTSMQRAWAGGARVGNDYWVIGGETPAGPTGLVERVSLQTGAWTTEPAWMLPAPLSFGAAAAVGAKIFLAGGYDPDFGATDRLQIFNTLTGRWTAGTPLPKPLSQSAVTTAKGKLYLFGGLDAEFLVSAETYIYYPLGGVWRQGAAKPTPVTHATALTMPGGRYIIVAGGVTLEEGTATDVVEIYDTLRNTWRSAPGMLRPRSGAAGAYYRGKPHVLFGSPANSHGELRIGSNWVEAISGPALLAGLATSDASGRYLFVLDGYEQTTGTYSSGIWRFEESATAGWNNFGH